MKSLLRLGAIPILIGISVSVLMAGEISQTKEGEQSLITSVINRTITYQGILKTNTGTPVPDNTYNLSFRIYKQSVGGSALWTSASTPAVTTSGYFSAQIGPISLPFDTTYYISIQVQGDVEMSRQMMTMSPYSASADTANFVFKADTANVATAVFNNTITSQKIVNSTIQFEDIGQNGATSGQVIKWNGTAWVARNDSVGTGTGIDSKWAFLITDTADTTLMSGGKWGIARNGNVLWGNADSTHINLGVQCTTGTSGQNNRYCTVGGGHFNNARNSHATVSGGVNNVASNDCAVVSGGEANQASQYAATIAGGVMNRASGSTSTIGGGNDNSASGYASNIGGGEINNVDGYVGTIGGGSYNTVHAVYGGIASGILNLAGDSPTDTGACVGGGSENSATSRYASINGGYRNFASNAGTAIGGGYFNVVSGNRSVICGGNADTVKGAYSGVVSGYSNLVGDASTDTGAFVGGGWENSALERYSTITGGSFNYINGLNSFIGGGKADTIRAFYGGIVSGYANTAGDASSDTGAFVGGGQFNLATDRYSAVVGGSNNTASGYFSMVGGGSGNTSSAAGAIISGGVGNIASSDMTTISGGDGNTASGAYSTIGGGYHNRATVNYATVAGGQSNQATDYWATIGGGEENMAMRQFSTIGGGSGNTVNGYASTISGGYSNEILGSYSCIPGGYLSSIGTGADYSMAFGRSVTCNDNYCVAFFGDGYPGSININRSVYSASIYPLIIGNDAADGNGAYLTPGGTWTNGSSRTFKENFTPFDGAELLRKISALSVTTYNYKGTTEKHVGPVAEEFVGAFDTGVIRESDGKRDDMYLSSGDVAGVALAGVQELLKKIEDLEQKNSELER